MGSLGGMYGSWGSFALDVAGRWNEFGCEGVWRILTDSCSSLV